MTADGRALLRYWLRVLLLGVLLGFALWVGHLLLAML